MIQINIQEEPYPLLSTNYRHLASSPYVLLPTYYQTLEGFYVGPAQVLSSSFTQYFVKVCPITLGQQSIYGSFLGVP